MKIKRLIVLTLFFLVIGFAAIATNLSLKGTSMFGANIDDFDVYFSEAVIDGEDYTNEVISDDKKTITFNIDEFKHVGDTSKLEYEVTNASTGYDAEVTVECEGITDEISLEQNPNEHIIKAREVVEGTLTIRLNRKVIEEKEIEYTCRLVVNAIERESIDESLLAIPDTYVIEGNYVDEEGNPISNANLVIYSEEPHYVTTDSKGYLFYNGLEKGAHEIYYVDDTLENIKKMSKEEVIESAKTKSSFTTSTEKEIVFNDDSKLKTGVVLNLDDYCEYIEGREWKFDYTGSEQEFLSICSGTYKIELWGASGGDNIVYDLLIENQGEGAYTSGKINLEKNKKIYIYVGAKGTNGDMYNCTNESFNGGGFGQPASDNNDGGGAGGGATDIRLVNGFWNNFDSLKSRIMVAGAGGGGATVDHALSGVYNSSGPGAGLFGNSNVWYWQMKEDTTNNFNASQTTGFKFGIGENGKQTHAGGAGAGGGYYGGLSSVLNGAAGGAGGGSSFISGHNGCNAITENSTEDNIVHTGQANHYSGYVFTDTVMIDGSGYSWTNIKGSTVVGMPTHDGNGTMIGNTGNGYAKITFINYES